MPTSPFYAKFGDPNAAARAFWFEHKRQSDQPRPSGTWGEQLSTEPKPGKKTGVKADPSTDPAQWQEGAGRLLLLAATHKTGLLTSLETALLLNLLTARPSSRLAHSQPATLRSQLLTLLFLEAVGLRRTWDLRSYTGQALALITGRSLAYGYRYTERFLAELAQAGADEALTEALASWTASLWKQSSHTADDPVPVFYIDAARAARHSPWL